MFTVHCSTEFGRSLRFRFNQQQRNINILFRVQKFSSKTKHVTVVAACLHYSIVAQVRLISVCVYSTKVSEGHFSICYAHVSSQNHDFSAIATATTSKRTSARRGYYHCQNNPNLTPS